MTPIANLIRRMAAKGQSIEAIASAVEGIEFVENEKKLARRAADRIRKQNQRARPQEVCDRRDNDGHTLTYLLPSLTSIGKPLTDSPSSTEVIVAGREVKQSRAQRKVVMPDCWQPKSSHFELCEQLRVPLREVEAVFRETTAAKGVRYVNWDLGFNTYIRNFNKFNGKKEHGRRQTLTELAFELADDVRQREREIGISRPDDAFGGH